MAGTPTNYFSDYAKSTGTLAAGANLEINLSGIDHQTLEGATVTRIFSHVNCFLFESSNARGVSDVLVVGTTGTMHLQICLMGGREVSELLRILHFYILIIMELQLLMIAG